MKFIKKSFKYLLYTILGFVVFVLAYFLITFILSSITIDKEENSQKEVAIYIKTNGMHTDLVLPIKNEFIDWTQEIKYSHTHLTDTSNIQFIGMGWGDKGFYLETPQWSDLKLSVAFKAAFGLSTTAIHATYFDHISENESCRKIHISKRQYKRLVSYINNTFQKNKEGHLLPISTNANYGNSDAFYEANGSYSLLHTCNTWANNGLKKCGQKACLWTPFDKGIFSKYQ